MIRDFFTFVYNEAFYEIRNNALELLIERLDAMSSQTISELTVKQTQQMLDQVRANRKNSTPSTEVEHIKEIVNSIEEGSEENQKNDTLDPAKHGKLMMEFDDKGKIMLRQLTTIQKMVGLVELSKRQTETPRVVFKLPVLFSVSKMKLAMEVAGEDVDMIKPIKKQFNAYMESYNSGDY